MSAQIGATGPTSTFGHGRVELVAVDSFEPGQMVHRGGGGGEAPTLVSLHGESTEAGPGPEPKGRKRDLRCEVGTVDEGTNVRRILATHPAGGGVLLVERTFTRSG